MKAENNNFLNQISKRFKSFGFKKVSSRENVEISLESADKTKFIEILSCIGGYYSVMHGFCKTAWGKSIDFSDKTDLIQIDKFLIKNGFSTPASADNN
jgi:hypothetical protein